MFYSLSFLNMFIPKSEVWNLLHYSFTDQTTKVLTTAIVSTNELTSMQHIDSTVQLSVSTKGTNTQDNSSLTEATTEAIPSMEVTNVGLCTSIRGNVCMHWHMFWIFFKQYKEITRKIGGTADQFDCRFERVCRATKEPLYMYVHRTREYPRNIWDS